jgi:hypothetical protein
VTMERSVGPVLIVGTERSGSNLLRLILNAHSAFAVPHPPHFMRYLAPLAASYGDLRVESHRGAFTRDALKLLDRHIHPWPDLVDREGVTADAEPTPFGVTAAIYERHRAGAGKRRWGCKSTFMVDHVAEVLAVYPDARFVWLVRDPLDVTASAKRSVFGHCHPYLMAGLWRAQQERALAAWTTYGPDTVRMVRYEDLVGRPEQTVRGLCGFLGEEFEPEMLRHHRSADARYTARLSESWSKAGQPISERFVGSHRDGLTDTERGQVVAVGGPLAARLGYPDAASPAGPAPGRVAVLLRSAVLRARVELRSAGRDTNYLRRVARDLTVRELRLRARLRQARRDRSAARVRRGGPALVGEASRSESRWM